MQTGIVVSVISSFLMVWAASPVMAAPIYRHVDAQGNVIYSDEPGAGNRVNLKPITVVDPAGGEIRSGPHRSVAPEAAAVEYERFVITRPGDQQTLPTGQAGNVQVKLAIEPALQRGDRVQLRVDGKVSQSPMHTSVFVLSQLPRGEHQLQADLVDAQGQVKLSTPPVTLYVQRASVNLPANPNNSNRRE
ncbi:DUF4124 domain-containing protein [Salinicola corii]|uniref:DUF4124 domain-containing protein n=2 Tax=Salinicola corii TaxID=2606937 RepID=A0A640WA62_9GAMM|nr:DUF4124 domain-containing protein [Salinicola corii]